MNLEALSSYAISHLPFHLGSLSWCQSACQREFEHTLSYLIHFLLLFRGNR